jgi:hypothetical protein
MFKINSGHLDTLHQFSNLTSGVILDNFSELVHNAIIHRIRP